MKLYIAKATCDWGGIFDNRQIKASSFGTAFARAGRMAHKEARRRPRQISVSLSYVGDEKRLQAKAEQE